MGCTNSRDHRHVDFEMAVDKLPPYSEACAHEGPIRPRDALELAINVAESTEDPVVAAALLVAAEELEVHAPDLRAKLLALLIACRLNATRTGFHAQVDTIVEKAIASLRASVGAEETPRVVAEMALAIRRSS